VLRFTARAWCVLLVAMLVTPGVALAASGRTHRPVKAAGRRHAATPKRAAARKPRVKHRARVAATHATLKRKPKKPVKTAPITTGSAATSASPASTTAASATTPPSVTNPPSQTTEASTQKLPVVASVATPVISGVTYYVSGSGSDQNGGTSPGQAWRTVARVNRALLRPGDGVLFAGGQTFGDADLEPSGSGSAQAPIVYGSFGQGDAVIAQGAWFVQDHLTFDHLQFGATVYGGSETHGTSNDITIQNCTIALSPGNQRLGVYANGRDWIVADNAVHNTGLSGMLLNGDGYEVVGNRIDNVGLYDAGYNAHGIYLDASNATITDNTITRFSESAVSARYRNSTIQRNYMSGGQIGIDFYQSDPQAGTSRWQDNTITNTTDAGIYVSDDGQYATMESFVIAGNAISPSTGVLTNLKPTSGDYWLAG
jgi:hypothetical protein